MQAHVDGPRVVVFDDVEQLWAALPKYAQDDLSPVVIVGAGACGLSAALHLKDLGLECLVLERDDVPSGSSALSSGFIPAAGTSTQKQLGLQDSPQAFAKDIQDKAHGLAAAHLVSAYTHAIPLAMDALRQAHGLNWEVLDHFLYPGHRQYRMHTLADRTGQALMDQLQRACQDAQVCVLTQARVLELWVLKDTAEVCAVAYQRPDQQMEHVRLKALLLACNGYGGNSQLVSEFMPHMERAAYAGHVGNDGSAVLWGRLLGAQMADMAAFQGHGSWAHPHGVLVTWALMMEGAIQVNALGQRFHNECLGYSEAALEVLAQPQGIAFNVFDAPLLELARTFPDFCELERLGGVKRFESIQSLAQWIGCSTEQLTQTLEGLVHNQERFACADPTRVEEDRVFERALTLPLFAIKVTGALFHTQGGLEIDAHCRVLRSDQTTLPNIWAGGGAARGVSGPAVWGYLSGNGLLSAMASAYIAAQAIKEAVDA